MEGVRGAEAGWMMAAKATCFWHSVTCRKRCGMQKLLPGKGS